MANHPNRKPQEETIPAVQEVAGMPAEALADFAEHAGEGVSTDSDDNLTPLLGILQGLSPQVNPDNPAYIEGARPGMIFLRNENDPLVSGKEGLLFQPCYYRPDVWLEWTPREQGGGLVGRYQGRPAGAKRFKDPRNPNVPAFRNDAGNELREYKEWYGWVLGHGAPMPYVIPFTSTGHAVSRAWMTNVNKHFLPDGRTYPIYANCYRLTTILTKKPKGEFYSFQPIWECYLNGGDDRRRGRALHESCKSGAQQASYAGDNTAPAADEEPPF